ncbi:hypothetical protein DPM19_26575 [Actinomadura craniellae]|uniref:DUF6630 domain-containing protein n=1 Tax=Actinomadura craniellae TaxID=2231787 RepID=A0A365GZN9_9ACTN|nr:hypothetical protein [Actinomadura craniellae]RAY12277.1 hypothetical protein DPM19_26575 [Actinomadura craniellae]
MTRPARLDAIAELLAPGQERVASEASFALDDPAGYVRERATRLALRAIDEPQDDLAWIALIDELTEHGLLAEIDWREYPGDIRDQLTELHCHPAGASWDWYDALGDEHGLDTYAFLTLAGERLLESGTALVVLDIMSDCYPLTFVAAARAEELVALADTAGYRVEILGRPDPD